jgi:hypothetical protein
MTANTAVLIEVPDSWDRVPAGEFVPLRLVVRRPADQSGPVIIPHIRSRDEQRVAMNTDLFQDDVELKPGESCALTVGVRFNTAGPANLNDFFLQVNPVLARSESERQLVPLPSRPVLVFPSLARQVDVKLVRICGYDQGVKLELTVKHIGHTSWEDFEISVGPADTIRAGLTCHQRPTFQRSRDGKITFDIVTSGQAVDVTLAGTADGERIEDRRSLPVPTADAGPIEWRPFNFLEPRSLTTDRITVHRADGGPELSTEKGVVDVRGGKQQYSVTIYPSHPQAEDVDLAGAPGQAEVAERKSHGGAWSFLLTIVDDPWWTHLVRLYYDVQTPGKGVLRGELYLLIHPSNAKLWAIAGTAGAAMTIQGVTALIPAVFRLEGTLGLLDLLQSQWGNWLMALSIPLFRAGLWVLDRFIRWSSDG